MISGCTLNEIRTLEDLERIEEEWRRLWERDPEATPFQGPDWLLPWLRRIWGGGELRVLEIRRGTRLAAIAPLFLWGLDRIHLSLAGSGITDYLGITSDPEDADEAAGLVLRWIAESCREWEICDLQELREDNPLVRAGPSAGLRVLPCSICPVAALPSRMEHYLAGLEGKFRHNLRSAEHRVHAAGRVEFAKAGRGDWNGFLDELIRLHEGRWSGRSGGGMLSSRNLQEFHRDVAARFAERGLLRLYALHVNGICIGVQYNFTAKGRSYAYLSGFDGEWSRVSPGSLLLEHAIRDAIAESARVFDFLRKPEEFKYWWRATDESTRRLVAFRGASPRRLPSDDTDAAVALKHGILDPV